MIDYPKKLDVIFDKLKDNNIRPVIVGGFIRDLLLGIKSKDIDIEIYGISSFKELENILKEFGSINIVGKSFGVCKLYFEDYDLDFSFPRRDNKIKKGHKGFDIVIDTDLDYKSAASRRDFTMNSIGYDVVEKKVLDPFCGLDDLKNKILKAVDNDSFGEDPLRVLRAVQFSTRFELKIQKDLFDTCKDMVSKKMLDELPKERVFEEIKKLLLYSKKPSLGFELLKELGSDTNIKNIHVIDEIAKHITANKQTNLILMLAGLCFDLKESEIDSFLLKFTNEKELLKRVRTLVSFHKEIDDIYKKGMTDYKLYKLASSINIEELLILSRSIYLSNNSGIYKAGEAVYKRAKELNILNKKLPALLRGKDLLESGLEQSAEFSLILKTAYDAQMRGEFKNRKEAIVWLRALNCRSL